MSKLDAHIRALARIADETLPSIIYDLRASENGHPGEGWVSAEHYNDTVLRMNDEIKELRAGREASPGWMRVEDHSHVVDRFTLEAREKDATITELQNVITEIELERNDLLQRVESSEPTSVGGKPSFAELTLMILERGKEDGLDVEVRVT